MNASSNERVLRPGLCSNFPPEHILSREKEEARVGRTERSRKDAIVDFRVVTASKFTGLHHGTSVHINKEALFLTVQDQIHI